MDTKENKMRKHAMKPKSTKRKEKKYKTTKIFRRKSLKSVGNFMSRVLKTLGTLAHFGDVEPPDVEDDDGGFKESGACTLSATSGNFKDELQVSRDNTMKKSCTVSSHGSIKDRLSWCYGDKTPGVLGLKNHGNTCFMNAVVQCLSNTDLLAEYLGLEQYKSDLCQRRVNGVVKSEDAPNARGEVTEQLASLVRALWTLEYTPQLSVEFKSIVSKYNSQFRGNSQHDALEFLLWLLDRVHEDANPSSNNHSSSKAKASVKGPVGEDASVSGPASTYQPGTRHSFVQEHFQAQYRSSWYHHSLPSSPYTSGPEGQRLPPSGTLSSEFLDQGGSTKVLLLICNTAGSSQQAVRFGPPFHMREDRTISWDQLQQSILSKLYYLMLNGSQAQNAGVLFKIRVVGVSAAYSYLSPQDSRPLYHPAVDRALKFTGPGGPPHVKLVIEWDNKIKECLFGNIQEEVVKDAESVRSQQQQHLQQHSCTLDECFQLYTKEEQLAPDDAWNCPHCKQPQQGMVKMSLWTLPDILILHLKRFRQVGERRNKLSTLVRFPLAGLDMAPHVVKRSQSTRSLGPWPPAAWKQAPGAAPQHPEMGLPPNYLYDLYAVCNHHGGMHGGHYTAYCRNSVDGQWYSYDDSSVDLVPEGEVCTRGAYILFYQRRNVIPPWSASSSLRGSTSSSMSDHWLIRLAGDSKRGSLVSRSSTTCPSSLPDSPESPVFLDDPPKEEKGGGGGFETRPFVRGLQGRSVSMRTPTKTRDTLSKVLPLRWSFGSKDRRKPSPADPLPDTGPAPAELVEYLESGRRPRCTKDSIITLMAAPPGGKEAPIGQKAQRAQGVSSSSMGGLSCVGRSVEEPDSPQIPEGQRRPASDRTPSLRRSSSKGTQPREDVPALSTSSTSNTLTRRSTTKKPKQQDQQPQHQPHHQEARSRRSSGADGVQHSSSTHSLRDGTLRRGKGERSNPPSLDHLAPPGDGDKPRKGEESKSHEGLLSFFRGSFLRKEKDVRRAREGEAGKGGETTSRTRSSSRVSLSNGAASGGMSSEGRTNGGPHHGGAARLGDELANGKAGRGTAAAADIKRSQSSSNIPSKAEQSMRRTASLHRNGLAPAAAAPARSLTADKPSYGTLQRTRYSTTSLGRKRTVPESSF
ncbi:ubiquitin carboxyl-terminal hydrolase 43a [Osmerus eperlanus]|uniref:ubiquitin carboxyl-terminal hydrolase 43a n=1 Tax=Osmerus eperlanus TaxID=29151 RepID=UPI002E149E8F